MPKLAKNYYYNSKGEKKLNCYLLNIPKEIVKQTGISESDQVKIKAKDGRIIIEKAEVNERQGKGNKVFNILKKRDNKRGKKGNKTAKKGIRKHKNP